MRLGKTQRKVLTSLDRYGTWYRNCGWVWDCPSGTERILDSLVERGLVVRVGEPRYAKYVIHANGMQLVKSLNARNPGALS